LVLVLFESSRIEYFFGFRKPLLIYLFDIVFIIFTLWLLVYECIVLENWGKTRVFRLTYQAHSSSADCARELFKPSKYSANLEVRNEKKIVLGFCFFVDDIISRFLAIFGCWYLTCAQPLDGSIPFKFSLQTMLKSAFFETLIDFVAFLVQKL